MLFVLLMAGTIICAAQALRARSLIASAVWLVGVSALTSVTLYELGAHEVAAIELSVGAGLVTVLFVFAISIAGEDAINKPPNLPRWFVGGLIVVVIGLLIQLALPLSGIDSPFVEKSFRDTLWGERSVDVLVQIVLIFAGVLGLLGLLTEDESTDLE